MMYAKQRDSNENEIVEALEAVGAAVAKLGDAGVPDLLVAYKTAMYLLEVKNPKAKGGGKYNTGDGCLTAAQTRWWAQWKGPRPVIVRTAHEALLAIGARDE